MNFNLPDALKMFKTLMAQYTSATQNKTQTSNMNMTESIFGNGFGQNNFVQSFGLQNTGLTDDMLMQAFGFQKSASNNQSVESLTKQVQSALENIRVASAKMQATSSPSDEALINHNDATHELEDLKASVSQAMTTANDSDKAKLSDLLKQLETEIKTQRQAHSDAIISPQEQKDLDLYRKTLGENDGERYDALMKDSQSANTKAEINQVISAITKESAKYQGLASGIKEYEGLKIIIDERITNFGTELETLNSKLAKIKQNEEK